MTGIAKGTILSLLTDMGKICAVDSGWTEKGNVNRLVSQEFGNCVLLFHATPQIIVQNK
jgi:hypothetical protein